MNPSIDLVIPVYRPDEKLAENIKRILQQQVSVRHIYLIETRTSEKLYSVNQFGENADKITITGIEKSEFDHGATRNFGASMSESTFIMFMTQDAIPVDDKLVGALVEPLLENENVAVSYARQLPGENAGFMEKITREYNYPEISIEKNKDMIETMGIKTFFCSDVCSMYRRSYFEKLGKFIHPAIFNEDMIMARKFLDAGYSVYYAADAKVIHSHKYTYMQQFRRNFDLAVSQAQHPEVFAGISSESEGIKMVKKNLAILWKKGKGYLIPDYILASGFKFIGYRMGKKYKTLPKRMIMWCSLDKAYWERNGI